MAELVVVSGPPGAGKSTVARKLAHTFDRSVLVEGDQFFGFLAAGAVLPWLPDTDDQNRVVQGAAAAATGHFVRAGYDTVYEGVLDPWHIGEFLAACEVDSLHYVVLLPSVDRCAERVANRKGHGFTDLPKTREVHRAFAEADVDGCHVLVNPPDEVDDVVGLIRERLSDGSLRYGRPV